MADRGKRFSNTNLWYFCCRNRLKSHIPFRYLCSYLANVTKFKWSGCFQ